MNLLSCFFILSITFKNVISYCPIVTCDGSIKTFANTTCGSYDPSVNTISLSKCLDNQLCFNYYPIYQIPNFFNINPINISCLNFPLQLNDGYYSGSLNNKGVETDYCATSYDCVTSTCVNNKCVGLDNNPCSDSSYCTVTSYCDKNKNKCKPRVQDGNNCSSDDYCINTSGCLNGKCVTLNFLTAGKNLNNTNSIDARFCISGWSNTKNICEDLINTGDAPYMCDGLNSICNYTSSITNLTVSKNNCNCDMITGASICPLGTNTIQYINYIEAMLNSLWYPCHYYNKGNCSLVTQLSRYYLLNTSFLWSGFTALSSNLIPCLAPTVYPDYNSFCSLLSTPCVKNRTNDVIRIYFLGILSFIAILLVLT